MYSIQLISRVMEKDYFVCSYFVPGFGFLNLHPGTKYTVVKVGASKPLSTLITNESYIETLVRVTFA